MSPAVIEGLKAWYMFSITLGGWNCLNLALNRRGEPSIRYAMMAFVILLLMPPLNAYVMLLMQRPEYWLFALSHDLTWAWGPILVVLIQKILLQKHKPWVLTLHALPLILSASALLLRLPLVNSIYFLVAMHIQVISYLLYALYLVVKNRNRILALAKQHKNTTYYWLLYLVAGLIFIMLFDATAITGVYLGSFPSSLLTSVVISVLALFVNTITLFAVYQPEVFFHAHSEAESEISDVQPTALRNVELSADAAKELNEQLQQLIKSHKPHLDEQISLAKLASLLGISSHQLSELLNIHNETTFYDFLNNLRYEEALNILHNADVNLTIADIAYQAGFNNRTSFYSVFKEKSGVTPSQYKKAMTQ